jgi:hypothetical protein
MASTLRRLLAPDPGAATCFAEVALPHLATLGPRAPGGTDLALEFGLSAWLRRAGLGTEEAVTALWALRAAVLQTAGIDPGDEPVPLTGHGGRQDTLTLASYLAGLLARVARAGPLDHRAVVARASDRLHG